MLMRKQMGLLKILMNGFGHCFISLGCRSSGNMGDEVWTVLITRFTQMDFVSCPHRAALFAKASIWVVGRIDELHCGRNIVLFPPLDATVLRAVVLYPDLA